MKINENSRIPVYVQIMNILIQQIEDGVLSDEEKLPSERELCELFEVSRSTVRQALQELKKDGFVRIDKGRGTFVVARRFNQEMSGLYGFTEYMKKLGKTISTEMIDFSVIKCDERIARKMQCGVGDGAFRFTRVRYADEEPMMIVTTHLPYDRFPELTQAELANGSLYALMLDKYHVTMTRAKETLQCVRTRKEESQLLHLDPDVPCMKIDRYTFDKDALVEYAVGIVRGDKFQYNVELR